MKSVNTRARASLIGTVLGLVAASSSLQAQQTTPISAISGADRPQVQLTQSVTGHAPAQTVSSASPVVTAPAPVAGVDPGKQIPGAVAVTAIDFKRGEGGAGRVILRFSGDGAAPDMRTQGASVVIDVANVQLPANLQKPLNVSDFATPVQRIDTSRRGTGAQLVLSNHGQFETMAYQTGRDYVVEIIPRAAQPARAVGASTAQGVAAAGQASATPQAYSGRRISIDVQNIDVRAALNIVAEEAGLSILVSDSVSGTITMRVNEVPWDQALDLILRAEGLDKRRSGDVVWVAPQADIAKYEQEIQDARIGLENSAELVTEYLPLSYSSAQDVARLLTEDGAARPSQSGAAAPASGHAQRGFLSPRGSLSFDRRTNTLLLIDIPKRVEDIKKIVAVLDKPVDQVVIEGRIVIAQESFARELGARFGLSGRTDSLLYSGSAAANQANVNASNQTALKNADLADRYTKAINAWRSAGSVGPIPTLQTLDQTITRGLNFDLPSSSIGRAGALALSVLNAGNLLDIELSALQTEGRGEVISNPRIVTSNQKEAVIKQGQEVGYLTITGGATGATQVPQVQFKEALLELRVTPTITNDGRVFLNMDVKKDEIAGFVDTGFGKVPTIAKRQVNTAILVEDGQTVVVGGVYEFKDQSDLSKVPFLGDIPIIGNLFKKRGRSKNKAELLIFVTPKVLRVAQRG